MKTSELVEETNTAVDNITGRRYSTAQVVRQLNIQQRSMVRKMVELDRNYFNTRTDLTALSAIQVHANEWLYDLPPWLMKLTSVREQADVTLSRGPIVPKRSKFSEVEKGWQLTSVNQLSLYGYSAAIDLTIECAKVPALLTLGTLPSQSGMGLTQMRMDADTSADAAIYPHETWPNGYLGALFEITGVNDASRQPGGQIRRVASSSHLQVFSGEIYTELTFDTPISVALAANDTYETHSEVGVEHLRLLVLLAARALLQNEQNVDGVRVIREELAEQWASFIEHIKSRDLAEPYVWQEQLPGEMGVVPWYYDNQQDLLNP